MMRKIRNLFLRGLAMKLHRPISGSELEAMNMIGKRKINAMLTPLIAVLILLLTSVSIIYPNGAMGQQILGSQAECRIVEQVQVLDENKFPWELLREPHFRKAYFALLGGVHEKKRWLSLGGPAPRSKLVIVNDRAFTYVWSCKQHECDTHVIHLLFDARAEEMFGLLTEGSSSVWMGTPSRCLQKAIEQRLLRK